MNNLDQIICSLKAQQPALHDAEELTDRIMQSLPEQTKEATLLRPARHWAVAASIAAIFYLGVAAAGAFYLESSKVREAEITPAPATSAPKSDFFVFDNVEMEQVAATLAKHYRLKPVIQNEAIKKLRVYLKVDKKKTIEEVVELLNDLDEFTVIVSDGKLIIK